MDRRTALLLLAFLGLYAAWVGGGVTREAFMIFSLPATLIGIQWFFDSRRRKPPARFETFSATAWLLFRRLIAFLGASVLAVVAAVMAFDAGQTASQESAFARVGLALLFLVMAAFCAWVGIYGQGENRYAWRDDMERHRENKRRYRWRS